MLYFRVFNLPTEHNYVLVLTNFTASGEFHSLKQTVQRLQAKWQGGLHLHKWQTNI
jgi:hypothetical protein